MNIFNILKRIAVFENIFYLGFIPIRVYALARVDF